MNFSVTVLPIETEPVSLWYNGDTLTESGNGSMSPKCFSLCFSLRLSCFFSLSFKLETRLDFAEERFMELPIAVSW